MKFIMHFKNILVAPLLALGFLWPTVTMAGDADFLLVNRTGYDIREIYVSPAKQKRWGQDRLGRSVLGNRQQRQFKFGNFADCIQDMRIVFDDDGSEVVWEKLDLCELEKIILRYNRNTGEVFLETE
jgi:hypothetical protein